MQGRDNAGFIGRRWSRRVVITITLMVLAVAVLGAMAQGEQQGARLVTDMRGRSVAIPHEVKRIIALDAGSLRLVSYLDATDLVIAVEDDGHGREKSQYEFFNLATYRIAHPELRDLPSIGSAANHEGIIASEADLIISSAVDGATLDQLQNILGIPVFAVDVDVELYDRERFYAQNEILGVVLNREERAKELNEGIKAVLSDLESRRAQVREPKRAYAGGMMFYGPADLLRTTGDFLPFDLVGAVNVMESNPTGNRQPYMTSLEDLIAAEPDYIFLDAANITLSQAGYTGNKATLDALVPAFSNQEVYSTFVYKYYGTNWEHQLVNVYAVGSTLYPELYSDFTIREKAEEIWALFFTVPLSFDAVCEAQHVVPGRVDWFN